MNLPTDDDWEFERLIDGELSFAEQRAWLTRLELFPEGWRKLALGLLEDRVLRREMQSGWRNDQTLSLRWESPPPPSPPVARRRDARKHISVAAACLLCLFVGIQAEQWRGRRIASSETVATSAGPVGSARVSSPINRDDVPFGPEFLATDADAEQPANGRLADSRPQPALTFRLADWPDSLEMPVVEVVDDDDQVAELLRQSAVTDEMRRELEAAGYVIHEQRKYVPVPLEDGREGIAPVSEISVEFVGDSEYQ